MEQWTGFSTNPLYALLHESIYCQGEASNWAAERVIQSERWKDYFDPEAALASGAWGSLGNRLRTAGVRYLSGVSGQLWKHHWQSI